MKFKCYISHYTKLTDRKMHMDKQLEKSGLYKLCYITWLTNFDKETLTIEQVDKYIHKNHDMPNLSYIANAIAHISALEDIAKGESHGLIMEDDLIFNENFVDELTKYIQILPSDWDMVFLSEGCNIHQPNITPDVHFYKAGPRCASCYLVNNRAAKKIISGFTPISRSIDWHYNVEIERHNLVSYQLEPIIAAEGSETGLFLSTV